MTISVAAAQDLQDSLMLVDQLTIQYGVDHYELTLEDKKLIESFLVSKDDFEMIYQIEAHTDSDGSSDYNDQLSKKRVTWVYSFLIDYGIPVDQISSSSHGEHQLLYVEYNDDHKLKNRRCVIRKLQKVSVVKSDHRKNIQMIGIAIDADTKRRIPASIHLSLEEGASVINIDTINGAILNITKEEEVSYLVKSKGYFPVIRKFRLSKQPILSEIVFAMTKLDLNKTLKTNIQFHGNQSVILANSMREVNILSESLLSNPEICIELQGHIHHFASAEVPIGSFDHGLSIARSLEIFSEMQEAGVSAKRMLARGYGNSQLIYPNAKNENESSANRRVELKVISCDSTATLKNDSIIDPSIYKSRSRRVRQIDREKVAPTSVLQRKFSQVKFNEDLKMLDLKIKRSIIEQLKKMKHEGEDPSVFTYAELLKLSLSLKEEE